MGYDLYRDLEIIKVVNEMPLSDYCSFKYRLIPVSVHLFIEAIFPRKYFTDTLMWLFRRLSSFPILEMLNNAGWINLKLGTAIPLF